MGDERKRRWGSELTCILCKHFHLDMGWGGTCETPGDKAEMGCRKDHWEDIADYASADDARPQMLRAQTCGDFRWYNEKDLSKHKDTGNFLLQSEAALKGQEKLNADVLAAVRKVCRVKSVTVVQDSVEVTVLHPTEVHIPVVGGSSHGKAMVFAGRPLPDIRLYTEATQLLHPCLDKESYTLCYLSDDVLKGITKTA